MFQKGILQLSESLQVLEEYADEVFFRHKKTGRILGGKTTKLRIATREWGLLKSTMLMYRNLITYSSVIAL